MDIKEVLLRCNSMRENEEGIGLSRELVARIVELAYCEGYSQNSLDRFNKMKAKGISDEQLN